MKEIRYTLKNGITESLFTEEDFLYKEASGCKHIGLRKPGAKRNSWVPLGMNVDKIVLLEDGKELNRYEHLAWR